MFSKILIANRGEIACRVTQTARRMGIATVAVYSDVDAGALHVEMADEAVHIGPAPARESYLVFDKIIDAAKHTGAEAIHPGYGFLSENPDFVEAVEAAGLTFIGPSASAIRAMGLKDAAKRLMEEAGVPVVPGYHGDNQGEAFLANQAADIGYPVLIKASAGGGGKGMRKVDVPEEFSAALASAQREAKAAFGNDHVLIEKFVTSPRHIEVQIFGDGIRAVHLFERDCSLQRRHQKVIEEAPAPGMTPEVREAMGSAAVRAAEAIGYAGAGTVEFIVDGSDGLKPNGFWFMEMNTRLQVEHPVTEEITGVDLVEWQLRVAAGSPLPVRQEDLAIHGHAFEARIYAEDPARNFLPVTGLLDHLVFPKSGARIDTGVRQGDRITQFYDPMIAKLTVHGSDRAEALGRLGQALAATQIAGTTTNIAFLSSLAAHKGFVRGEVDTGLIERDQVALTEPTETTATIWGLAALTSLGLLRAHDVGDPWSGLSNWRLWGPARMATVLASDGEDVTLPVESEYPDVFCIETPEGPVNLTVSGSSSDLTVLSDGHRFRASTLRHGAKITVFAGGHAHAFTVPDPLDLEDEATGGGDRIAAPMTGLIKTVDAEPGAFVSKGDALIVMEAMKMEHTLRAPRDGVLSKVSAKPGDQVEEGAVLVSLESDGD